MAASNPPTSPTRTMSGPVVPPPSSFLSYHEQLDARLVFGSQPKPNLPYQVKPLADLRAGSLPPTKEQEKKSKHDDGNRTEPESAAEDTTDYSSSDQYEKTAGMARNAMPHYNVLMSNPLADLSIPSYAGTSVPTIPSISQIRRPVESQLVREKAQPAALVEDDDQQPGPSNSPSRKGSLKQKTSSILRGDREFSRMSFNPRWVASY